MQNGSNLNYYVKSEDVTCCRKANPYEDFVNNDVMRQWIFRVKLLALIMCVLIAFGQLRTVNNNKQTENNIQIQQIQ